MTEARKHQIDQSTETEQGAEGPEVEPGAAAADPEIAAELAALQTEREELQDRLMRALADAENARKRADKDRRDAETYGGTRIVRDMLPVYDSLQRALSAAQGAEGGGDSAVTEGIELTLRELVKILERHGVTRIAPAAGDPFDPQHHEAMFEASVPDIAAGNVIQVMAEGFMLHDRLLRPAQVGVSSTPSS